MGDRETRDATTTQGTPRRLNVKRSLLTNGAKTRVRCLDSDNCRAAVSLVGKGKGGGFSLRPHIAKIAVGGERRSSVFLIS